MSVEAIDIEGLKRLSGNDIAFVNEILKLYGERTSRDVEELRAAYDEEDWNAVRFVVHRMRSAAVPLGLKNLVVILKRIELALKNEEIQGIREQLEEVYSITSIVMRDAQEKLDMASA